MSTVTTFIRRLFGLYRVDNLTLKWIGRLLNEITRQQKANMIKKRKLRALRAVIRAYRVNHIHVCSAHQTACPDCRVCFPIEPR